MATPLHVLQLARRYADGGRAPERYAFETDNPVVNFLRRMNRGELPVQQALAGWFDAHPTVNEFATRLVTAPLPLGARVTLPRLPALRRDFLRRTPWPPRAPEDQRWSWFGPNLISPAEGRFIDMSIAQGAPRMPPTGPRYWQNPPYRIRVIDRLGEFPTTWVP